MYVNTNVKMTRQEVEEETKVLEKIFDVVRILDGEFLSKIQDINVNIKMYIFDHLRMYIFAIPPLDRYIFSIDKIFQ